MRKTTLLWTGVLAATVMAGGVSAAWGVQTQPKITQGTLRAIGPENKPLGDCPLEHTDVQVDISGFVARIRVTQKFANPFKDKIEAVYTFPLGADAAVTDMTMKVGKRIIRGQIKPREEARLVYEQAKAAGHVASLLDQERPNIFTQSVANIEPGKRVEITITYTEILKYEEGKYQFVFPMVVGPRYIPGSPTGKKGTGFAPDTVKVPDASRITPPVAPKGERAGHDIALRVTLDAGMKIKSVESKQHKIGINWRNDQHTLAKIELTKERVIPNKDFVLEYTTAAETIGDTMLMHTSKKGGYFALILEPPKKVQPKEIRPRELVFVIDSSGSMNGFPIDTAKNVMSRCVKNLRPNDTFNMITFAGSTSQLWNKAMPNTEKNRTKALEFLKSLRGAGGTEMMKAIRACLGGERDPMRTRIVCFMTDAYVGNDMAIVDAVRKNVSRAHVFSFGIGRSVNRYLLDNMARAGRGDVEYVLAPDHAPKAARRFYDRIDAPVLGDITIDWGGLEKHVDAMEVFPRHVPDLFSVKPLILKGRFKPGRTDVSHTITIRGTTGAGKFERKIKVTLPAKAPANDVIAAQWARAKVAHLMDLDLAGAQVGKPDPAIKETIVGLGVGYRLLTQYTSFVAVEEKVVTIGGQPRTVAVPVEMPEGVSHEGVFGPGGQGRGGWGFAARGSAPGKMMRSPPPPPRPAALRQMKAWSVVSRDADSNGRFARESQLRKLRQIKADKKLSDDQKRTKVAEIKLAKALGGLADKLDKNGNYSVGKIVVKGGKMEVAVYLYKLDDKALAELKALGFVKILESKAVQMVIGTVDVKKLAELAWLDAVRRIDLPTLVK